MTTTRDALDLWADEDRELLRLFTELDAVRGSASVEDRVMYGDLAKDAIQHLATREAALHEIDRVVCHDPALRHVCDHFESGRPARRALIDRVERMSRGVQGINLNTGQDFDGVFGELADRVRNEIDWDLREGAPTVRECLARRGDPQELASAEHVAKHAPTNLDPSRPRWYERAPVISRLLTIYDELRDFPRATKHRDARVGRSSGR